LKQIGKLKIRFQIVGLRLSRVNHACVPNAAHWCEESLKVKILFSEKDIKGELQNFDLFNN
jgi:hypothetical protein